MTHLAAAFFLGLFFFNAIPHLVRGICGKSHMTPFRQKSGPLLNVVWAWVNIIIGVLILKGCRLQVWGWGEWVAFGIGGFVISVSLAIFWANPEARLPWHRR